MRKGAQEAGYDALLSVIVNEYALIPVSSCDIVHDIDGRETYIQAMVELILMQRKSFYDVQA